MKKVIALVIVLLVSQNNYASIHLNNQNETKDANVIEELISSAISILNDSNEKPLKELFSPEAYVINDNQYQSAFEVLANPNKKEKFVIGKNIYVEFSYARIPDNFENAYLVLKTFNEADNTTNWHTILHIYKGDGNWQILSWHKS